MEDAKKSSKRFLVIYCLAIFVFAVALILITYISQTRSAEATDALQDKLTNEVKTLFEQAYEKSVYVQAMQHYYLEAIETAFAQLDEIANSIS